MEPRYSDIEFANIMKKIPTGHCLVIPIKGSPYFLAKRKK